MYHAHPDGNIPISQSKSMAECKEYPKANPRSEKHPSHHHAGNMKVPRMPQELLKVRNNPTNGSPHKKKEATAWRNSHPTA
jgi:hypothetical protein